MKYAKAMYRGGEIVPAENSNYQTNKRLGVVCPFCAEALYLRREHWRNNSFVPAAWCHYKNDDPISQQCELRSQRPEGLRYIAQLEVEARQQRLELFNKRLWEIVSDDRGFPRKKIKQNMDRFFGKKWIESYSNLCRIDFRSNLDFYQDEATAIYGQLTKDCELVRAWTYRDVQFLGSFSNEEARENCLAYFALLDFYDGSLHLKILREVMEFLATRTGGYAYQAIFRASLLLYSVSSFKKQFGKFPTDFGFLTLSTASKGVKEDAPGDKDLPKTLNLKIVSILVFVNWLSIFYKLGDKERK